MYCIHIQNIQFIDCSFISKITSANAVFIFILFYNLVCFMPHHHSVLLELSCSLKWLKIKLFLNSMFFVIRLRKLSNKPWHIFFYYSFQKIAIWNILHRGISLSFDIKSHGSHTQTQHTNKNRQTKITLWQKEDRC